MNFRSQSAKPRTVHTLVGATALSIAGTALVAVTVPLIPIDDELIERESLATRGNVVRFQHPTLRWD